MFTSVLAVTRKWNIAGVYSDVNIGIPTAET
jgi:hypothetical protein